MNKKGISQILALIFLGLLIASLYYLAYGGQLGIWVSCEDKEILGIKKVPPPAMVVVPPPPVCLVDLEVSLPDENICLHNKFKMESSKDIIPCKGLKNYRERMDISITATFYDLEGNKIGEDLKQSANFWS